MSASLKMISSVDPEQSVLITHDKDWSDTKFYSGGELIREFANSAELKSGVKFKTLNHDQFEFKLHPATNKPTLKINGTIFIPEKAKRERVKNLNSVLIVFGLLITANLLFFMLAILRYNESFQYDREFAAFVLFLAATFLVTYVTSFIFLVRGVLFFYFVGTGMFLLSTCLFALVLIDSPELIPAIIFLIRVGILIILLYPIKRVIKAMNDSKEENRKDVLDADF